MRDIKNISVVFISSLCLAGCGGGGGDTPSASSSNSTSSSTQTSSSSSASSGNTTATQGTNVVTPVEFKPESKATSTINNYIEWSAPKNIGINNPKLGLKITEVSSLNTNVAWFEIYNPNEETVNLGSHKLKSMAKNTTSNVIVADVIFDLPDIDIPAHGYAVVSPKLNIWLNTGADVAFIEQSGNVPTWIDSGYIELLYNNNTTDMLSFNKTRNATDKSFTDIKAITLNNIKESIALWNGSWQSMNFATPAGDNDIEPNAIDEDGDGIPSIAKQKGKTFGGLDIYSMGARKGQKDVFIQLDYMNNEISIPQKIALDKLVQTFDKHNIALHIDAGSLYSNTFNVDKYNLGQGKLFASYNCTILPTIFDNKASDCNNIFDYKKTMQGIRRKLFHYVLLAKSQVSNSYGPSGMAEYLGKNVIITLDGWGLKNTTQQEQTLLSNYQAGALMHEIGHNFGLLHGGNDNITYKPNYVSVMNYLYQLRGVTTDFTSSMAMDRFYNWIGAKGVGICSLNNSPCNENFIIDYSKGDLEKINEHNINESTNLFGVTNEKSNTFIDWDNNGVRNATTYYKDLNQDNSLTDLSDYNDWDNLKFNSNLGVMTFKAGVSNKLNPSSMFMGEHSVIKERNLH